MPTSQLNQLKVLLRRGFLKSARDEVSIKIKLKLKNNSTCPIIYPLINRQGGCISIFKTIDIAMAAIVLSQVLNTIKVHVISEILE